MLNNPMDALTKYPVRKSKKQKASFRKAVCVYAQQLGYPVSEETGKFGAKNIVMGNPEKANYLVTAHYDTCAWLPVPNVIMPCNFWLFQLLILLQVAFFTFVFLCVTNGAIHIFGDHRFSAVLGILGVVLLAALMLTGPANRHNANDNTSGVVTLLEMMRTMPENQRHKVCFVLFDLEEVGMIGSASYRKAHEAASDHQMVLNLDCVGDGDHLVMFPTKSLKKDRKKLTSLYRYCGYFGKKSLTVHEKGFSIFPSDQLMFPYGVGICALRKCKMGLYVGRIHTSKDTVLEETNVNILRAALISYICCDAAQ